MGFRRALPLVQKWLLNQPDRLFADSKEFAIYSLLETVCLQKIELGALFHELDKARGLVMEGVHYFLYVYIL